MILNDAHCHFFSSGFFRTLAKELPDAPADPARELPTRLGWDPPGDDEALADRWTAELDGHGVRRAMLMSSVPGDEEAVAAAVSRHPDRFVGAFMFNPMAPEAEARLDRAFERGLRLACLFPAMLGMRIDDPAALRVFERAAAHRRAVFVHCGILSIGVRKKLGLPNRFDLRCGDPLAVAAVAARFPDVPVIVPHFGAGFFREALMAGETASNLLLDTSSSNGWIRLQSHLSLADVFRRTLDCLGASRILFGTDSSFFPRGWQAPIHEVQRSVLHELGVGAAEQAQIFGGNFDRVFGD